MSYATALDAIIPLSEAEEAALVLRLPDEEAATELVMRTLPAAVKYLNKICRGSSSGEELMSLCYAALRKSVRNVKPGKGRFMLYSKIYLRGAMFATWKTGGQVKGVKRDNLVNLEEYQKALTARKLNPCHSPDKDELTDGQVDETECHPTQDFEFDRIDISELWALAKPVIDRVLTDHEKLVVQLRFSQDYSFEEIAEFLAVSRSAAQGSCERALRKIRVEMNKTGALKR